MLNTNNIIETGVLILKDNRTYTPPKNINTIKKYYKCISRNDINKTILIPYIIKHTKKNIFNKVQENLYIIYEYDNNLLINNEFNNNKQIIIATLKEVIGCINSYDAFQKYEMCSRNIYNSLNSHNKYINTKIAENNDSDRHFITTYNIPLLQKENVIIITIDPKNSMDLDDAISITHNVDNGTVEISIYISLVSGWIDYFDNWKYICDENNIRITTIYLPNGEIRPIFPTILSHNKMSLLADNIQRPVLKTTIIYDNITKQMIDYTIKPELIYINKNFIYNTTELIQNSTYQSLMKFTYGNNNINADSHKLIEYWMIENGLICGKELKNRKLPAIYRECIDIIDSTINLELGWKLYKSKYILNNSNDEIKHIELGDNYVHITSPIRRWVDIWNQSLLLNGKPNELANNFIFQKEGIHIINNKSRDIQKTQKYCILLYKLHNSNSKSIICDGIPYYDNDKSKWIIYLPEYKLWNNLYISPLADENTNIKSGITIKCSVISFEYEHNIRKKIKIMIHS